MGTADRNQDIRLDPDVPVWNGSGGKAGNQAPLVDRYGLAVFAKDVQQREREARMEEKQMLRLLRQNVFDEKAKEGEEEEIFWRIHSQIFAGAPGLPGQSMQVQKPPAQGAVIPQMDAKHGDLWGMGAFSAMAAGMAYLFFRKKRRHRLQCRLHGTGGGRE